MTIDTVSQQKDICTNISQNLDTLTQSQKEHYQREIAQAQKEVIELLNTEGWHKSGGTDMTKGLVHYKQTKAYGKVFRLRGEIDIDALQFYTDLVENHHLMNEWNPSLQHARTLAAINENTELSYNISTPSAGGLISSRDFVYIRHWEEQDGWYLVCSLSTVYKGMPHHSKYVRGHQGPTIVRMKRITENKLLIEWTMNIDVKGWIPRTLVEQTSAGVLLHFMEDLRKHAQNIRRRADSVR